MTEQLADQQHEPREPDLRRRVLDAAHDLVSDSGGLKVSLEHLNYEEAIRRARVPRSSVYRVWPTKDDFMLDLLCDLAGPEWQGTAAFDQKTIDLAGQLVAERLDDLRTADGRRRVLRDVVRQAAKRNFDAVITSAEWRTYVTLTATLLSMTDASAREKVEAALRASEQRFISLMVAFYENTAVILGVRLRPPHTNFKVLAAVGSAVIEGLALRQILAPDIVGREITIVDNGQEEVWSLPAFGFMSLVEALVEPAPDYDPDRAIAEYMKRLTIRQPNHGA